MLVYSRHLKLFLNKFIKNLSVSLNTYCKKKTPIITTRLAFFWWMELGWPFGGRAEDAANPLQERVTLDRIPRGHVQLEAVIELNYRIATAGEAGFIRVKPLRCCLKYDPCFLLLSSQ